MVNKLIFKLFFISGVIILFLFLISCTVKEKIGTEAAETGEENITETSLGNETEKRINESATTPESSGACTPRWRCVSKFYKAYQHANCSFRDKKECKIGCENGTCQAAVTCESGFKCKNHYILGFQNEDCTWSKESNCNWGCADAKCKAASSNTTTTTNVSELMPKTEVVENTSTTTSPVVVPANTLVVNQPVVIEAGGAKHNLSIYILDLGKVRLKIDDFKSDWLTEGQAANFTVISKNVSTLVRIRVAEILFQPYENGKKQVGYRIE